MKKPPQDVLITLGMVLGLSALFALVAWWPTSRAKADHQTRVEAATERLANIDASEAQRLQLEKQVRDLESGIERDEHYVPTSPQLSAMLRGVTESARQAGVWEQEVGTDEFRRFADFSVIPASLGFEADFGSALGVLEAIEKQRRLTAVQRTEIDTRNANARDLAEGQSRVAVEMELVSFFSREEGVSE